MYDDPKAALKELKQINMVSEYQTKFEELSTKVMGLSEAWLISFFIAGLQDHLKCELLLAQPKTYYQAISLSKLHEQKVATMQNSFKSNSTRHVGNFGQTKGINNHSTYYLSNNKHGSSGNGNIKNTVTSSQGSNAQQLGGGVQSSNASNNIKRLSVAELRSRKEKGLCYYCEEKYQPNHRCKAACFL